MIRHRYEEDLDGWLEITEELERGSMMKAANITALVRRDP